MWFSNSYGIFCKANETKLGEQAQRGAFKSDAVGEFVGAHLRATALDGYLQGAPGSGPTRASVFLPKSGPTRRSAPTERWPLTSEFATSIKSERTLPAAAHFMRRRKSTR